MHPLIQAFAGARANPEALEEISRKPAATRAYAILFTPRSGSSLLTEVLMGTKQLGRPVELLNPTFIPNILTAIPAADVEGYADAIRRTHQTENGVFGVEVTPYHIAPLLEDGSWWRIFPNMRYVVLTRKDVVAQAISLFLMVKTGISHTTVNDPNAPQWSAYAEARYDASGIYKWLRHIVQAEWMIEHHFADQRPLRITYEQFIGQPSLTLWRLAYHVRAPWFGRVDLERYGHKKIAGERNMAWAARFREKHGDLVRHLERNRGTAPIHKLESKSRFGFVE